MYIQTFQNIGKKDLETAGGKGANLGEMTGAGIPVPPGAVLTAQAYRRFMKHNGIDVSGRPGQIRAAICAADIPEDVKAEILEFYRSMGEGARVAVRSSATVEDLEDASFAGQQETFLNVQGEDMLLDCIKACYASLWGERAVSYRKEKGYDSQPVALAVVIQRMVESEVAGVLFTQNPSTGEKSEMLINASYGLGESVVLGAVSPDELVCSRDGQVIKQVVGTKETKVIYGEKRTVTVPVEAKDRSRLSLSPDQIRKLVRKGAEIEAHYQAPMDIEWAFAGNELYILQARAITAKAEKAFEEALMPPIRPVNKKMKAALLFMLEKEPFSYDPLDYDFSMILGKQKAVIFAEGGILVDNDCGIDRNGFMSLPTEKIKLGKNILHLPAMLKDMKNHPENVRKAKAALEEAKPKADRFAGLDCSHMEMPECLDALTKLRQLITDTAYARFYDAVFPGFMMNRELEKYLKRTDENLTAYNLLSGLSYKTADINRDLAALAEKIKSDHPIKDAVLSGKSYEEITEQFPKTREWFGEFFGKHGYKSDFNCYCFRGRAWEEDKDRFLQVVKPLLSSEREKEMSLAEGEAYHQDLLGKMTAGLKEKQKREVLRRVEYYRFYHVFREETQYLWETFFFACRKILKRTAELFGVTTQELLYLFWDELQTAMKRGALLSEELDLIGRRRNLRPTVEEYWRRQQWEALKGDEDGLKGISGSAGEAIGEVCIVTSPAEFHKLKKGDILVCRYTDPEWTPLFTLAAAVVSDTGGVLSHAAIVAREYHIPAVLAAGCATTQLKDGDRVFVNGTTGEVRRI
ncbi:MAG: PEP/pyruvate-binding domain-containing protein [Eubacteriales bacterium]|nr:PEP/pyruvate-binding domain-containing protein [Eubacteriales bacterium]